MRLLAGAISGVLFMLGLWSLGQAQYVAISPQLGLPQASSAFTCTIAGVCTITTGYVTNAMSASMANSTIKGRTTSGTGVPEDLTAAQAAAIIGGVGGALKSKFITTTYDLSTATGTQAVNGFGFQPTACAIITAISAAASYSIGFVDSGASQGALYIPSDALVPTWLSTSVGMVSGNAASSAFQIGTVTFAADGVSIAWTKAGSPTGTLQEKFLCFR